MDRNLARKIASIVCPVLLALVLAVPVAAQEERLKELNAQVVQLYQQGKYAEAIPIAQEQLRVAEATFGAQHPNVALSLNNLAVLYREQGRYARRRRLTSARWPSGRRRWGRSTRTWPRR